MIISASIKMMLATILATILVTVCGPATVTVNAQSGMFVVYNYTCNMK